MSSTIQQGETLSPTIFSTTGSTTNSRGGLGGSTIGGRVLLGTSQLGSTARRCPSFVTSTKYVDRQGRCSSSIFSRMLPFVRQRQTVLWMGKGDGKKRRKKSSGGGDSSSSQQSASSSSSSSSPAPLRVSNDINIPVRHQIRMAQLNKQARQQSGQSFRKTKVARTSYRRTWDEEEVQQKAEERKRRGQEPDWDIILSRNATSPLVIVDGYNIIHKWPRLRKHMIKGDTQRARQLLIDDLENLRSLKGWRIECVFDGTKRASAGPLADTTSSAVNNNNGNTAAMERATKKDVSKFGVRVVFTGVGIEADSYIEARCAEARAITEGQSTNSFIVATDDSMIRLAGQSAGAHCMSADRFVTELKAVKTAVSYRVEAAMAQVNGHAIRPEKLRGTTIIPSRFGRGSVLIEDKRNRTKTKQQQEELLEDLVEQIEVEVEEDEDGVPWWAKLPTK